MLRSNRGVRFREEPVAFFPVSERDAAPSSIPPPTVKAGLAARNTASAHVYWEALFDSAGATDVLYELAVRGGRDADWRTAYVGSYPEYTLPGLFQGTAYSARVRRVRAG
eukprot:CAMPEP_0206243136 /NCGR_PEP_ID=MMETSP0047_2-20121206/17446_1 /ASSEMBLY_ACC=CAM_ASM_000192 /TAXON_ID=195065 /ORGANISM="Chroomonas mesostigmatica_cf, Strain CCMP1168" /LENGTH=109 /DNA_ID=CAMNT_0053668235 /DNA_START=38 /DNA_END=363 /DNA_ORIENTATION=-